MKSYIKDGFKDISMYRQELANLENNISYIQGSINDANNSISQLNEKIAITQAQIQYETSELKKAQLLSSIAMYNNQKTKLNTTIE
jgi:peptidoglycan hydrolase CwlO-like protein